MEYIDLVQLKELLSDAEFKVLSAIGPGQRHIDEIIARSGLAASAVLPALTMLELGGYLEQTTGKYFRIIYER